MKPEKQTWELVVLGAGSAGLTATRTARLLGARVLLVERHRWGGDCLWTGCVPSKALISQARDHLLTQSPDAKETSSGVFAAIDLARDRIAPDDSPESLEKIGVETLNGDAVFTGPHSLSVDGRPVGFTHAIVATGSRPALPDIPGLDHVDPLTSDTIWDLRDLPGRMLVLGGGAIGCELGQALARLSVQVTIVHRGPDILPGELPEARELVRSALEADGVQFRSRTTPVRFQHGTDGGGTAILDDDTQIDFDRVIVATGRRPVVEGLGLVDGGVCLDEGGWVSSDPTLRTDNPSIWAAGDVTWLPKHTHMAGVSGSVAARNALLGTRKTMADTGTRVLFTSPEIASVGRRARPKDRAVTMPHQSVDRAVTEDDMEGFTQIIVDRRGRIVGGTIVSPRAGETLGELALAVDRGVTVEQLTSVIHPYPTYSDGLWNAAVHEFQRRVRDGVSGRAANAMRRLNLWRAHRRRTTD